MDENAAMAPVVLGDVLESLVNEGGSRVVVWTCKVACLLVTQRGYNEPTNQRSAAEAEGRNQTNLGRQGNQAGK